MNRFRGSLTFAPFRYGVVGTPIIDATAINNPTSENSGVVGSLRLARKDCFYASDDSYFNFFHIFRQNYLLANALK